MDANQRTIAGEHRAMTFGSFVLDLDRAELFEGSKIIKLRRQSFDVLCYLAERHGKLVEKRELLDSIWGDAEVTEDSLTHCIIDVRRALGDVNRNVIKTIPRRGFVFNLPVKFASVEAVTAQKKSSAMRRHRNAILALTVGALLIFAYQFRLHDDVDLLFGAKASSADVREAKRHYVQGQFLFHRRSPGDILAARENFQQAIALNPAFAEAWAGLAGTIDIEWNRSDRNDDSLLAMWRTAAETAIELNPDLAGGLLRLGRYHLAAGDREAGEELIHRAASIDPNAPLLLEMRAQDLARQGDLNRAIELQRLALDKEPLSFTHRENLSYYLFARGQYKEALNENLQAYQLRRADSGPNSVQGYSLILLHRYHEALRLAEAWPASPEKYAVIAMANFRLGHMNRATKASGKLDRLGGLSSAFRHAELLAFCEEFDRAFGVLYALREKMLKEGSFSEESSLKFDSKFSPFLAPMRSDPRWQDWLTDERRVVAALGRQ